MYNTTLLLNTKNILEQNLNSSNSLKVTESILLINLISVELTGKRCYKNEMVGTRKQLNLFMIVNGLV